MRFHFLTMVFENFESRHRFLYFQKKVGISPIQAKFATSSHFVKKLAQIIKYGQTIIENV